MGIDRALRDEDRKRLAHESLEAHEREFRERVVRLEPGPGDEFFAQLVPGLELEQEQRDALQDFRSALVRVRPRFVEPSTTSGELEYLGGHLKLSVRHKLHPDVAIKLTYGDGYLSLTWPWGEAHDRWSWSPLLARVVEALPSGQNRQTVYLLRNRPVAADTWLLDQEVPTRLRRWRNESLASLLPRRMLRQRHASISFDEPEPVTRLTL